MKDLELLVRYQDGELNDTERKQLIERLKNDKALNNQLDLIEDVDRLLGDKELSTFEDCLRDVETEYLLNTSGPKIKKTSRIFWLQIAAVAVILISTGTFLFVRYNFTDLNEKLYSTYYQKLPADFATRSENPGNDSFINAIRLYNENKYPQAIVEFKKIIQTDPSNNAVRLFLGICYVETNNPGEAIKQFKHIVEQRDTIFEEHAAWYLALCYIKTNSSEKAKPLLVNLVETKSYYLGKAAELLKKLK